MVDELGRKEGMPHGARGGRLFPLDRPSEQPPEDTVRPVITTLRDRCRRCYSCVRRCPAKAIRVREGQAEVITSRCVACGRCLRVCSQRAKQIADSLTATENILAGNDPVVLVAPSFPAGFPEWKPGQVLAAFRRAGFRGVHEVAFGADLVSRCYRQRYDKDPRQYTITTPCPAAVKFIEKHAVSLIPFLAPILSPMAAMGKALKTQIRPGCRTVFAGPCTAKLLEIQDASVAPWIDVATTFFDVRELFHRRGIIPAELPEEDFDPPYSRLGGVFPIPGGLISVADLPFDLLEPGVSELSRRELLLDTIERLQFRVREGNLNQLETRFFDVLFCAGCLSGPAMPASESLIKGKQRVAHYVKAVGRTRDEAEWQKWMDAFTDLDLSCEFTPDNQRSRLPTEEEIRLILAQTNKFSTADELNCRACGYRSCREKAEAVYKRRAEVEMCLPFLVERLRKTVDELNHANANIREAQTQLIRSERLACMGQLAAGIAHEVNNPLGTILIFSHLLQNAVAENPDLREDAEMILREATRCKNIVGGLLDFARQNKIMCASLNLVELVDQAVGIVEGQTRDPKYTFERRVEPGLPPAFVDRNQILQVLVNIIRNGVEAMKDGGTITISACLEEGGDVFLIVVSDTGPGIADEHMSKMFSPFFTTKQADRGTGLGLPISYGIVRAHQGRIVVKNNENGVGARFEIQLPRSMDGVVRATLATQNGFG